MWIMDEWLLHFQMARQGKIVWLEEDPPREALTSFPKGKNGRSDAGAEWSSEV